MTADLGHINLEQIRVSRITVEISSGAIDTSYTFNADNAIDLPTRGWTASVSPACRASVQCDRLLVRKDSASSSELLAIHGTLSQEASNRCTGRLRGSEDQPIHPRVTPFTPRNCTFLPLSIFEATTSRALGQVERSDKNRQRDSLSKGHWFHPTGTDQLSSVLVRAWAFVV